MNTTTGRTIGITRALACSGVICFIVMLNGCSVQRVARVPNPVDGAVRKVTLAQVMEATDERPLLVKTLAVRLNVILRNRKAQKDYALMGSCTGDRNGNFRMQLRYNETVVFDLAMRQDDVDIWLPRKDKFFRGLRADAEKLADPKLALLIKVANIHDLFVPSAWAPEASERRVRWEGGREIVSVFTKNGWRNNFIRRLELDVDQPTIRWMRVYTKKSNSLGLVRYSDYRFPEVLAGEGTSHKVPYPGQVTLVTPDSNQSLQLDVEEMFINEPVPPTRFQIKIDDDVRIRSLKEAAASGRPIWE